MSHCVSYIKYFQITHYLSIYLTFSLQYNSKYRWHNMDTYLFIYISRERKDVDTFFYNFFFVYIWQKKY